MRRALVAGLILLTASCSYGQDRPEEVVTYGTQPDPDTLRPSTTANGAITPTTATDQPATGATTAGQPVATTPTAAAEPDAGKAMVTIVSTYPGRVVVMLNGVDYDVPANSTVGPFAVTPEARDADWFRITNEHDTCGGADSDDYFAPGQSYRLRIASRQGKDRCEISGLPLFAAVLFPGARRLM